MQLILNNKFCKIINLIVLRLTSISCCDNKSFTISKLFFSTAICKEVLLNAWAENFIGKLKYGFHKTSKLKLS